MKNSEVLKTIIENRRSTFPKSYSAEVIDASVVEEILSSATFAPNHKRTKPWRFEVFEGETKKELGRFLAKIYKETVPEGQYLEKKFNDISEKISKTPVVIVINVNFSGLVPEWEEIAAVSMAVQNMYLTATVHDLGCYWSSPKMINHLAEFLGLRENQKCLGLFYLGAIQKES